MIRVPPEFMPRHPVMYPGDNVYYSEDWMYLNWSADDEVNGCEYLPIQWTAYQCNNGNPYRLKQFVDKIKQPAWTLVQHDDGIPFDLPDNIRVFAMSSPGYPLPLLCTPHRWQFDEPRSIFASFIGGNTHPIRQQMFDALDGNPFYRVAFRHTDLEQYCGIMARSTFALCPRGYGVSSFRIAEAIQYGSIPVYVSDYFIQPYGIDFNEYGVLIQNAASIHDVLISLSREDIEAKRKRGEELRHLFTYEGMKEMIIKTLRA